MPKERTWIYMQPVWVISIRVRMLEFYSDNTTQFINTLILYVIQIFDKIIFNFAKLDTVPCMFTSALSHIASMSSVAYIESITDPTNDMSKLKTIDSAKCEKYHYSKFL